MKFLPSLINLFITTRLQRTLSQFLLQRLSTRVLFESNNCGGIEMEGIVQVQSAKINHVQVYVYEVFPMICFGTKSVCGLHACTYKRSIIISKQLLTYDWSGRIKVFHAVEIIRTKYRVYIQNRRLPSGSNESIWYVNKRIIIYGRIAWQFGPPQFGLWSVGLMQGSR